MNCIICNKLLTGKQKMYCSKKCKAKNHQYNCYEDQCERGLKRKLEFIKLAGGKCNHCGYNRNISALEFHHIDPQNKIISLDLRHLSNHSMIVLTEEFKKCKLLCANCHAEYHNPKLDMKNFI